MSKKLRSNATRARRKSWLVTLASPKFAIPLLLLLVLLAAPLVYRGTRLRDVPDIGHPFDFEALVGLTVRPEDNAYEVYSRAAQKRVSNDSSTIALFLEGAKRPDALSQPPAALNIDSLLPVVQELRALNRLVRSEGLRREAAGDVAGAWTCYEAMFRSSQHCARHGCMIERMVSLAIHAMACEATLQWSTHPEVHVDLVRQALREVERIASHSPVSNAFQMDYVLAYNSLTDSKLLNSCVAASGMPYAKSLGSAGLFCLAEPDLSIRLKQLQLQNILQYCDLAPYARPPLASGPILLFDPPAAAGGTTAATPADIQKWVKRSPFARLLFEAERYALHACDQQRARQSQLITALALQIFYREHDRFPDSLAELQGSILAELPADPFGHLKSGRPDALQYRREPAPSENATLWSIGNDRVDQHASIKSKLGDDPGDIVVPIYKPGTAPVGSSHDN